MPTGCKSRAHTVRHSLEDERAIAQNTEEVLMPETMSPDTELLIADVEDISWNDLIHEMLPDRGMQSQIIQPIGSCDTTPVCDTFHCRYIGE
jgi:hypothetical protein